MDIANNIKYIGADDLELDLFEGQYVIPEGISYNSYVILDEKVAVLDTIDARKTNEWLKNLADALQERVPDYLVVSHMEPDHGANVQRMMERFPDMKIVCTGACQKLIQRFFHQDTPAERFIIVKDNDTLALGQHTLQFITAPMVHWPEVMLEYEQTTQTLFSADAFGKFGALCNETDDWACEARRYYFNIVGKYGPQVQALIKKLAPLSIKQICPLHGPVLNNNLGYYIGLYNTWSSYQPETEGIFIAYCSLHGNTEHAALKFANILKSETQLPVVTTDLRRSDMAEAVEDAFRYSTIVLAAPTYDNGLMPIMNDFLHHLAIKNYQNRKVAIIQNGSWAPVAGKIMLEKVNAMKNIQVVEPMVTIPSTLDAPTTEELKTLAHNLLQ